MTAIPVTTVTLPLNEIIREAFDLIGVGAEGEAISADMYRRAKSSLNLMVMTWNTDDNLWRQERIDVTPIADQAAYILSDPKPLRVTSAVRKNISGGYETPMTMWSRQEYLDMPNKTNSPSTPVNFYYNPGEVEGTLYLWPAPSTAVIPTMYVIIDTLRPMLLLNDSNDTLDCPIEWQETVVFNLAARLKLKYPVNDPRIAAEIDGRADALYAKLKAFDNETASFFLQPDDRWGEWR